MQQFKRFIAPLVASLSMLGPLAIDTYLPSFPDMATDFSVTQAEIAHSLAIFLFAFAIGTLAWGPLMDRFGRLGCAMLSLTGFSIASLVCAFASDYQMFMTGRLLQGLLASGSMIAGHAMVRDLFHGAEAQKVMSKVMLLFAIAPGLAPIIGGWLHDMFGWRSVFYFLTSYGVIAATLLAYLGKETLDPDHQQSIHPKAIASAYQSALLHPSFRLLVLSLSITFGGLFVYIAGSATLVYDILKLNAQDFAVFFVPMVAGMMLGTAWVNHYAHRIAMQKMIYIAFAILMGAAVINTLLTLFGVANQVSIITPLVFYAFGIAVMMPNLSIMIMDCFPKNRGMANAVRSFVQMSTNALVAALVVPWVMADLLYYAYALLAFALIGLLCYQLQTQTAQSTMTE